MCPSENDKADRIAEDRDQQGGTPSVAIGAATDQRRAEDLHRGVGGDE